jgi:hypothetical protein
MPVKLKLEGVDNYSSKYCVVERRHIIISSVECSAVDQVVQPSAQSTATAPTVLPWGKKEITPEARAAESKKRAARWLMAKQKEKDKKATDKGIDNRAC